MTFSLDDMRRFATEAWGPFGGRVVDKWADFNVRYFAGRLRPVPLVLTKAQPFGRRIAYCSYSPDGHGRTITLNVPSTFDELLADNNTLLHEMIHQHLFEQGEDAAHAGAGWRREIMRLHQEITGTELWAGRSTTVRRDGKVVRMNVANPDTAAPSLGQMQIARWPHEQGIELGTLGST